MARVIFDLQPRDERQFTISGNTESGLYSLYINDKYSGRIFHSLDEAKAFVDGIYAREEEWKRRIEYERNHPLDCSKQYEEGTYGVTYYGD